MSEHGQMTGPGTLEFRRRFDAGIERVWQFLVDPDKRKLWFCGGSTDDHVGGDIIMDFDHRRLAESAPPEKYANEVTTVHRGQILEYDPPQTLAFAWFESEDGDSSIVRITLSANEDGSTTLHLVHENLAGRDIIISVLAGWHGHFDLMAETLAGPRTTDFWQRDQELEAEYDQRLETSVS